MPSIHASRTEHLEAPPACVREAIVAALGASVESDATLRAPLRGAIATQMEVTVAVRSVKTASTEVVYRTRTPGPLPWFAFTVVPLLRLATRRSLRHAAACVRSRIQALPEPAPPRPVPFAPSVAFSASQATALACAGAATAVTSFGASLASQNVQFVARAFGATDRILGVALAASRAGVLIGLFAAALSDRRGRRRLLLFTVAGVCAGNGLAALAPNLAIFTAGQVLVRGFSNAGFAVAGIIAIEEAPDGARAYAVTMLSLSGALGYGCGLVMLPLGDLGGQVWRTSFALSAMLVAIVPSLGRHLRETMRYDVAQTRIAHRGRVREVVGAVYGSRFRVLLAAAFLGAVFGAPGAQFQNRYLAEVRGFSGLAITIFVAVTGMPILAGLLTGARLAETAGRRPVATVALLLTTLAQMSFFLVAGPALWLVSALSSFLGGVLTPVLGALGIELFATEIRGTANGFLLVSGVAGAAVGLVSAGLLSEAVGGIGRAIALTGVAGLLVVPLIPRLPESAWRTLEEVSPSLPDTPSERTPS